MTSTNNGTPGNLPRQIEDSDAILVSRVLAGEREVFAILVDRYNQQIFRTAHAILRDAPEAEDVAQQTMVMAFQKLSQWRQSASLSRWITRIAANEAHARLRRRKRRFEHMQHDLRHHDNGNSGPEMAFARQQVASRIEQAVDRLPPDHRSVFVLRDVEELNTAETAMALNISEASVRVRLHRARAKIRETLKSELGSKTSDIFAFACDRISTLPMEPAA